MYKHARAATRNLSRPLDQLLAGQLAAATKIIDHAYNISPFYRERFKNTGYEPGGIRKLADVALLPRLSKTDLIQNMEEILCAPKSEMISGATSGTTGITLTYYRSLSAHAYRRGIDLAIARYYGWQDGQWQGWLWGAEPDALITTSWRARIIKHWVERRYFMDVAQLTNANYQKFVDDTRRFQPTYVSAYPTLAFDLAGRIETGEVSPVRVPVVSTTAEPLLDHQRAKIRAFLADEVFDRYGAREYGIVAMECREHRGMHTFMDSVYLESVPTESTGSDLRVLLVTDLLNFGMPLIRYDSGDYADLDSTPCPCGITTPRVHNIRGRVVDTIWRPDGSGVDGLHVTHLVERAGIHAAVQIVQEAPDRITVRVEARAGEYAIELESLLSTLRADLGSDIRYRIERVDKIDRAASAKYRFVISNVERPRRTHSSGERG
jgi:phenylacetate-CoA ligase